MNTRNEPALIAMLRWILHEAWEKINIVNTWHEIKALGKKYGKRFFWAALIWECIEDIVFPFISWKMGVPELIPVFLVLHFEPIVYPAFFWGFRTWDRVQGKEPWNPDRAAYSHHWRSVVKVFTFQLTISGWLLQVISWKPLLVFVILTSFFSFIHERIWHDSNWGILSDDSVQLKRTASKVWTYLLLTTFTLFPVLRVTGSLHLLHTLLIAQGITGMLYLILERVWAKSVWGITHTGQGMVR
jgi:hypothetical protein